MVTCVRKAFGLGVVVWLVVSCFAGNVAHAAQAKPLTSTSWYVQSTSSTEINDSLYSWMEARGRELGQRDLNTAGTQSSLVILSFGQPQMVSGVYGTSGFNRPLTVTVIGEAVRRYARGYWNGSGTDTSSKLRIVIGTNNSGFNGMTDSFLYNHGAAWIKLVKDTAVAIQPYASQVSVRGGNDIEVGYSSPAKVNQWILGYVSGFVSPYWMYHFGDAQSCPQFGTTSTPAACTNGWTQDHVELFSWGSAAYPVPQIYATAGGNAKQWQQIELYSCLAYVCSGVDKMTILGVLTQKAAWDQRCAPKSPLPSNCVGVNNTPQQAWDQLWNALNGDSRTAQSLGYSTDIKHRVP